jgi:hypothetical protein
VEVAVWTTLIGLIERWWREKPRADLVRALVGLQKSMQECQNWYEKYWELKRSDPRKLDGYPSPGVEWVRSLTHVGRAIVELDSVLKIFDSKTHETIERWLNAEMLEATVTGTVGGAAKALGQPTGIDIKRVEMDEHFHQALEQLNEFIRTNFEAAEVHAAIASRFR